MYHFQTNELRDFLGTRLNALKMTRRLPVHLAVKMLAAPVNRTINHNPKTNRELTLLANCFTLSAGSDVGGEMSHDAT